MTTITTDRLTLFPLTDNEMQQIIERETDETMKQAYSEMLTGCKENPAHRIWHAIWVMQLKSNHQIIGDLSFKGLNNDGMVEIGYGIHSEFEGRGLMTEAVTAMTKWAYEQPGVNRIEAETEADNLASQKVLVKSGFIPTGKMGEEGPRYAFCKMNYKR